MTYQPHQSEDATLKPVASDEPTVLHPVVRALEQEAINLYREQYPDGPPWQELVDTTRQMWVEHAERKRAEAGNTNAEAPRG